MASRNPDDLHPDLLPIYKRFMNDCFKEDIDVLCTCTYRSPAEQDLLYEQGRTAPGAIVTNARGGQSAHNYSINGKPAARAFDIVPLRNGKCVWGTSGADYTLWSRLGVIGQSLGLDWYGAPNAKFKEFPHFQLKN